MCFIVTVSLNDHCDNKENQRELWNATQIKSAAIVTATQFRDGRGRHEYGCSMKLFTKHATGLIVSFVEMNLRDGLLNGSCIDYLSVETKYSVASEQDRCGKLREDQHVFFHTSQSVTLKLHTPTPLSSFFEGYTLAAIVTSFSQVSRSEGKCGPQQFQCASGGRCIYKEYVCDNVNNCGDNSDEANLGNSMCLMPLSSLILISMGATQFAVTWILVLCCCIKSALKHKKAIGEDICVSNAPPVFLEKHRGRDGALQAEAEKPGSSHGSAPGSSRAGSEKLTDSPTGSYALTRAADDQYSLGAHSTDPGEDVP
ncbi:uncharacterized protein LOC144145671 [Haemaphysalis longicornis]